MHRLSKVFVWRCLAHLLLLFFVAAFSDLIFLEGTPYTPSFVFFVLGVFAFSHFLSSFFSVHHTALLGFFLADAFLVMILIRASGGSSSPFIVLFPLLSLSGSLAFRLRSEVLALTIMSLALMGWSVGWGVSIAGNALAIVTTTVLGKYLAETLFKTGEELERSEGARRRLENLQKAILANIPSGMISVDSEGLVIQINRVGAGILGVSETEILNRPIESILPKLSASKFPEFDESMPLPSHQERMELRYHRLQDKSELHLGYSIVPLKDPGDGEILGSLVVFQDLTTIKKLEAELRVSEKLAAVGKLAAGIAHEIRNPLAGISGSAQMLLSEGDLTEDDQKLLNIIQRESLRLDHLISEFLEFVKPQKPGNQEVSLLAIAEEVIEGLRYNQQWKELGAELTLVKLGEPVVRGDKNKVTQVLLNLLLNAGQAQASKVELHVGPGKELKIFDDGTGMNEETQRRLFEPFFTTKERGTGLGLAVSYRVLEAMGAHVKVKSPIKSFCSQNGSLFEIKFKKAS